MEHLIGHGGLGAFTSKLQRMQPPLSYVTCDLEPGVTLAQWGRRRRGKRARARRLALPAWRPGLPALRRSPSPPG
jgi:hypothetical protein